MEEMIIYLINNPEVVQKVVSGEASLLLNSDFEKKAVLDAFSLNSSISTKGYWK